VLNLRHAGVVCRSEENADRFYRDLLGLDKAEPKVLPAALSQAIFGVDEDLPMINYTGSHAHFEVFISKTEAVSDRITHACIEIADLEAFLRKCAELGVEVNRVPKGEAILTFIRDFDGNLFEVKS